MQREHAYMHTDTVKAMNFIENLPFSVDEYNKCNKL